MACQLSPEKLRLEEKADYQLVGLLSFISKGYLRLDKMIATSVPKATVKDNASYTVMLSPPPYGRESDYQAIS